MPTILEGDEARGKKNDVIDLDVDRSEMCGADLHDQSAFVEWRFSLKIFIGNAHLSRPEKPVPHEWNDPVKAQIAC